MKLSWNWLKTLVPLDGVTPEGLAEALTLSGSKVETVETLGDDIRNVVVGRVIAVEKHPQADRLFICAVDAGGGAPVQIVTGADNVTPGALVPVALDGAKLPDGVEIRAGTLRGAESGGMLCSAAELGLDGHDEPGSVEGILLLDDPSLKPGTDIRDALMIDDIVFDFEITNNRPDCLSVTGLAREAAAALGRAFAMPGHAPGGGEAGAGGAELPRITVEEPELCPRYVARVIGNVKIEPSPRWMRRRLRACGIRPINNIVDITNYVLLELGQPMHAFDRACLRDSAIIVRRARPGESICTLDGQPRALTPDMLVIADPDGPVAVAGVMGGAASEITKSTREIVFESANFNGPSVRKTALALAMRTDASSRFEKGLDPENTVRAADRACELVTLLGAGEVVPGMADVRAAPPARRFMPLDAGKINSLIGTDIPSSEMEEYLARLGFKIEDGGVEVPSWRADVSIAEDLAEEVARLYGYDRIPATLTVSKNQGRPTEKQRLDRLARDICRALGFDEMLTYSFVSPSDLDRIRVPADSPLRNRMTLINPLGEDTSVMRTTALPSLLAAIGKNSAARNPEALLFELATVYLPREGGLPEERTHLVLGGYGGGFGYRALKGAVEEIIRVFRAANVKYLPERDNPTFHPGRCANITCGVEPLGVLGEIHPEVLDSYGITGRACLCSLDMAALRLAMAPEGKYVPLPRFPAATRDLALVCPADMPAAAVRDAILASGGEFLESCELFDVYTGKQVGEDTKSVAFALSFRAANRTLRDAEADAAVAAVLASLERELGVKLRA